MNYTTQNEDVEFIVSLDYSLEEFSDYECLEWGNLYEELGLYGNNPLIIKSESPVIFPLIWLAISIIEYTY